MKYEKKIKIGDINNLVKTLLLFIFPSNELLTLNQGDVIKEIILDKLMIRSVLLLLQEICANDNKYIHEIAKSLITPLTQ